MLVQTWVMCVVRSKGDVETGRKQDWMRHGQKVEDAHGTGAAWGDSTCDYQVGNQESAADKETKDNVIMKGGWGPHYLASTQLIHDYSPDMKPPASSDNGKAIRIVHHYS